MGLVNIPLTITSLDKPKKKVSGEFLVDTGTAYTVVPSRMWRKLELKPQKKQRFSLADGTVVERDLSYAIVEVEGQKAPSTVVLGKRGDSPLLGVITLENMGLMVDPFKRKLRPMKLMLG